MNLNRQLRMVYIAIAALLFAVLAVSIMYPRTVHSEPLSAPPTAPKENPIAGSGLVEAKSENIPIANPVAGVIEQVAVKARDQVKAGDILYKLETRHLEADLAAARCKVDSMRAASEDASMKLELLEGVKDSRAIRVEELKSRRFEAEKAVAELAQAEAEAKRLEVEIERQIVRAPIDGEILRVEARPGEYAAAGRLDPPMILMGDTSCLHLRVDIPEDLAWKVLATSRATGSPRGRGDLALPLDFVRIEPYVRPKQSLTGNPDERVDTRVAQFIYALPKNSPAILVGQQMDVFISGSTNSFANR